MLQSHPAWVPITMGLRPGFQPMGAATGEYNRRLLVPHTFLGIFSWLPQWGLDPIPRDPPELGDPEPEKVGSHRGAWNPIGGGGEQEGTAGQVIWSRPGGCPEPERLLAQSPQSWLSVARLSARTH